MRRRLKTDVNAVHALCAFLFVVVFSSMKRLGRLAEARTVRRVSMFGAG
jgi:hypothetical protein